MRRSEPGEAGNGWSDFMREHVEKALAVLVGKPLWMCRRAADMAMFQFGAHVKTRDFFGKASEVGEYALHVQCAWRISKGNVISVGSRDLYYPANYQDESQEYPADFDWDREPNRRDKLLRLLFADGTREFIVERIEVGAAGAFRAAFSDGFSLEVFPDNSFKGEHWRLLNPEKDEPQFVMTGIEIEASV